MVSFPTLTLKTLVFFPPLNIIVFMSRIELKVISIILDMDGVITNTMPDHYRAWKVIFRKEGIPVTYEDIYTREGQPGIHSVKEIFEEYGKTLDGGKARQILKDKERCFKKIVRCRFIPGARSFLRTLHRNQFRLALVTGTSRHELEKILPAPLRKLFEVTVSGCEVDYGKPHPEPYLKSLERLKIKPSEAVVIENAPLGIHSAKAAGLKVLALETSLPKKYLRGADAVFPSIRELRSRVVFLKSPQ